MKASAKRKMALEARVKAWVDMPTDGMIGTTTKRVRHDNKTKTFIKPGSQNGKKGGSGKKSRKY